MASGSHRECMVLVLQEKGWYSGWRMLMRIIANARAVSSSSRDVLKQVSDGTCLAGFAVNFDGMALAAESDGALEYIDPPKATAAMPDIISVLTTSTEPSLAEDFVRYVLSDEGQMLWGVTREQRAPIGDTLYHYPIAPSLYADHADKLSVANNPLESDFGLQPDPRTAAAYGEVLKVLVQAAGGKNHVHLQQVWEKLIAKGMPNMVFMPLTEPPFSEERRPWPWANG